jgi:hypothetical protein
MRLRDALAPLLVLLCSCSAQHATRGSTATPSAPVPSVTPTPTTTPTPTAADIALERALVDVHQLPSGYVKDARPQNAFILASRSDPPCARHVSAVTALHTVGALTPVGRARASFNHGPRGPFLRVTVVRYASAAAAAKAVAAIHTVVTSCPAFTATNPKTHAATTVQLTALPFPSLGDEGVAVSGRLARGAQVVMLSMAFVRQGPLLAYIADIRTGPVPTFALQQAARAEVSLMSKVKA